MMEIIFFISIASMFFAYLGYPISLAFVGLLHRKEVRRVRSFPSITVMITAYNEEMRIKQKLENTLILEYPRDKLQIVVVSDGSSDETNEIVKGYDQRGIELLSLPVREGKESAQKIAIERARGEILVFTDVATMLDISGLKEIVSNFADPSVGCASSVDRLVDRDGRPCGEGYYVRYEMWLRKMESRVNSVVGLSGSFFACRREVCLDFSGEMQSDFRSLLNSIRLGYRGVSDPHAIGYYRDISDERQEYDRKIRTVLRGLTVFFRHIEFLNIFRYGLFSYQYFCHKFLRWSVPLFLVTAFMSNLVLSFKSISFALLFISQLVFYALALWTIKGDKDSAPTLLKIPAYFLRVNTAIAVAWWRYLKGNRVIMWTPSER